MEFRELTNILTIAEEGSLSKAAEKLFVSQSSLSQFLKSYEAAIGCSLFVRTSTGMRPTEAGERVLEAAHQIVAIGNNLQNELWDIANLSTGKVSLGLTPFRGSFVLPDILPAFYAKYPQITIHTVEANTQTLEDYLLRQVIDVALLTYPLINKKLPTEDAYEEEVYLAVNRESPVLKRAMRDEETGRSYINFEDVMDEPFILLSKGQRLFTLAESQFEKYGCKPHVIQKTQNPETSIRPLWQAPTSIQSITEAISCPTYPSAGKGFTASWSLRSLPIPTVRKPPWRLWRWPRGCWLPVNRCLRAHLSFPSCLKPLPSSSLPAWGQRYRRYWLPPESERSAW